MSEGAAIKAWQDFDRHELLLLIDEVLRENPLARLDAVMCARARWIAAGARSTAAGRRLDRANTACLEAERGRSSRAKDNALVAYRVASRALRAAYAMEDRRWSELDALSKRERA